MQRQLKKALHDLQEEKEMNKCLLENQSVWQQRVTGLEVQIKELTQMKDKVNLHAFTTIRLHVPCFKV